MDTYNPPVVMGPDGDDPMGGAGATPYGSQWLWETNYVVYVEIGVAAIIGAVVQVIWSQVDLTP